MGIIKAVFSAMGGGLADTRQEVIEADQMGEGIVLTRGVTVRRGDKRNTRYARGFVFTGETTPTPPSEREVARRKP